LAGQRSPVLIDAELEALAVEIVPQRLHAGGKLLRVGLQASVLVALRSHPGIVKHQIPVTGIPHPAAYHDDRNPADLLLIDLLVKAIPTVPAHRWRGGQGRLLVFRGG
jgi:hypothetical protein